MNHTPYFGSSVSSHPHGGTPNDLLKTIQDEASVRWNKPIILFDPCPNNPGFDGLKIAWPKDRTVFVNPPYTRGVIGAWVKKAHEEWLNGCDIVMLIPSYTDTKYFHEYIYNQASIKFLEGRLKFKGYDARASFPSMIVYFSALA